MNGIEYASTEDEGSVLIANERPVCARTQTNVEDDSTDLEDISSTVGGNVRIHTDTLVNPDISRNNINVDDDSTDYECTSVDVKKETTPDAKKETAPDVKYEANAVEDILVKPEIFGEHCHEENLLGERQITASYVVQDMPLEKSATRECEPPEPMSATSQSCEADAIEIENQKLISALSTTQRPSIEVWAGNSNFPVLQKCAKKSGYFPYYQCRHNVGVRELCYECIKESCHCQYKVDYNGKCKACEHTVKELIKTVIRLSDLQTLQKLKHNTDLWCEYLCSLHGVEFENPTWLKNRLKDFFRHKYVIFRMIPDRINYLASHPELKDHIGMSAMLPVMDPMYNYRWMHCGVQAIPYNERTTDTKGGKRKPSRQTPTDDSPGLSEPKRQKQEHNATKEGVEEASEMFQPFPPWFEQSLPSAGRSRRKTRK